MVVAAGCVLHLTPEYQHTFTDRSVTDSALLNHMRKKRRRNLEVFIDACILETNEPCTNQNTVVGPRGSKQSYSTQLEYFC